MLTRAPRAPLFLMAVLVWGPSHFTRAAASPDGGAPAAIVDGGAALDTAPAEALFKAGRKAYQEGRMDVAATLFERSFAASHLPSLRFDIAQAWSKQFLIDRDPRTLQRAIEGYRDYLKEVPEGPKRTVALQELRDLTRILATIAPETMRSEAKMASVDGGIESASPTAVSESAPVHSANRLLAPPADPSATEAPHRRWWPIALGVGAGVVVAGVAVAVIVVETQPHEPFALGSLR